MASFTDKCSTCNKSSLSLLLLRPSPIGLNALKPVFSEHIETDTFATADLLSSPRPTQSRFVLRTLRPGYVHIYIPNPPPGVKAWQIYRVSATSEMVPEGNDFFVPGKVEGCTDKKHNALGMKLVSIPQAHLIPTIWIAFSANLWCEKLRSSNKANPLVMQEISLGGKSPNTFQPTEDLLKKRVLEFAVPKLIYGQVSKLDYPFTCMMGEARNLTMQMAKAAGCHPLTQNKELAVVLRDPVAIATELNALRLLQHGRTEQGTHEWSQEPKHMHAFNSSSTLMGLKELFAQAEFARALEEAAPTVSRKDFENPKPTPFNPMGQTLASVRHLDGQWEPSATKAEEENEASPNNSKIMADTLGRVWKPGAAERFLKDAEKGAKKAWADLADEYSEADRKAWHDAFLSWLKNNYLDDLEKMESDWWNARKSVAFNNYFTWHFYDKDPNDPKKAHSPGLIYVSEVASATTPGPLTRAVVEDYLAELEASPLKPTSVMLRALCANQENIIKALNEVVVIKAGVEHLHEERNDKLFDLGAGLVQEVDGALNPHPVSPVGGAKYGWLTAALGNLMGGYSLAVVTSLESAVSMEETAFAAGGAATVSLGVSAVKNANALGRWSGPRLANLATKLGAVQLAQRATDMALAAIINNQPLRTPVCVTMRMPAGRALFLLTRNGYYSHAHVVGMIRDGHVTVELHTDNREIARFHGDLEEAARHSGTKTKLPVGPLLSSPVGGLRLSEMQYARLFQRINQSATLLSKVRKALNQMGNTVTGSHTVRLTGADGVLKSLEGRLAIGVILLNGRGVIKAYNDLGNKAKDMVETSLALSDGVSSVVGAALQIGLLIKEHKLIQAVGTSAAKSAMEGMSSVHYLRFGVYMLGSVAGVANGYSNFRKGARDSKEGLTLTSNLYYASAFSFWGMAGLGLLQVSGAAAERILLTSITSTLFNTVFRAVAVRLGAAGVSVLNPWILGLLALSMVLEVLAVVLTPNAMEKWIQRSYFGKGSSKKFYNWQHEQANLMVILTGQTPVHSDVNLDLPPDSVAGAAAIGRPVPLKSEISTGPQPVQIAR